MADPLCGYPDREDVLITYLYDDMDAPARATFDAHLVVCVRCRREVNELQDVRESLAGWAAPTHEPPIASQQPPTTSHRSWWREMPAWAQVAAALLFIGVSAGIANLDVRYDAQGLSIRTGWSNRARPTSAPDAASVGAHAANPAPWRADLASLEQQLRGEMRAAAPAAVSTTADTRGTATDAELTRRIRTMIEASEKRQQTELAFRVAEAYNNMRAQRNADLMKVDSVLGALKTNTDNELLRQRASINYLVSTTQKQ